MSLIFSAADIFTFILWAMLDESTIYYLITLAFVDRRTHCLYSGFCLTQNVTTQTTTTTRAPFTFNPSPTPFQYTQDNQAQNFVSAGTTIGSMFGPIGGAVGGVVGWIACAIFCDEPGERTYYFLWLSLMHIYIRTYM